VRQAKRRFSEGESPSNLVMNRQSRERKNLMVKYNQQPKTESCPEEGQAPDSRGGAGAEQPKGSVDREKDRPQTGVAPGLSNSASKRITEAGGDGFLSRGIQHRRNRHGEVETGLPGSKSVACLEGETLNLGGPESSRRTNYECQAGRKALREAEQTEDIQGVGSSHSRSPQRSASGVEVIEGDDAS